VAKVNDHDSWNQTDAFLSRQPEPCEDGPAQATKKSPALAITNAKQRMSRQSKKDEHLTVVDGTS
jgi:hypothetical protein